VESEQLRLHQGYLNLDYSSTQLEIFKNFLNNIDVIYEIETKNSWKLCNSISNYRISLTYDAKKYGNISTLIDAFYLTQKK